MTGGPVGWQAKYVGPTGTDRIAMHISWSVYMGWGGGAGRAEFHSGPPCRAATESLNGSQTKLGHIFTCDCYLKNLVRTSSGIYSPRAGAKKLFFLYYRLWTSTEHISATDNDINNQKETCQFTGISLHAPKFGDVDQETAENGWWVFAHRRKFSHWLQTWQFLCCTILWPSFICWQHICSIKMWI